jgi:hypothetical protein
MCWREHIAYDQSILVDVSNCNCYYGVTDKVRGVISIMYKSAFDFQTKWYKWSDCELQDGVIKPAKDAFTIQYNPFDFFTDKMQIKQSEQKIEPLEKRHIHTSFATLDTNNPEELLRWVKAFGMPYSVHIDKNGNHHKNFPVAFKDGTNWDIVDRISIDDLAGEISIFRNVVELYNATINNTEKDLEYIRSVVSSRSFYNGYEFLERMMPSKDHSEAHRMAWMLPLEEVWNKTPAYTAEELQDYDSSRDLVGECGGVVGLAKSFISLLLDFVTQDVREVHLFEGKQLRIGWKYGSLLALLYKMLSLEWSRGRSVRKCANPYCGVFYTPYSPTTLYCSDLCSNRVRQQNYRKAHKDTLAKYRRDLRAKTSTR